MPTSNIPEWVANPIEYLVRIEFPAETAQKELRANISGRPHRYSVEYLEKASNYRKSLKELPLNEVQERAKFCAIEQEQIASEKAAIEESYRWFNLESSRIDIEHWSRMSMWTIEEATALSLDRDPRCVKWEQLQSLSSISAFASSYSKRRDLLLRANHAGQLWEPSTPSIILAWAGRMRIEFPKNLVIAIHDLGIQVADWKTLFDDQKLTIESMKRQQIAIESEFEARKKQNESIIEAYENIVKSKTEQIKIMIEEYTILSNSITQIDEISIKSAPLKVRERESLFKLVIGMAIVGYKFDPNASKSNVVSEITGDLDSLGISLDQDTVRKYLQLASQVIPKLQTDQKR